MQEAETQCSQGTGGRIQRRLGAGVQAAGGGRQAAGAGLAAPSVAAEGHRSLHLLPSTNTPWMPALPTCFSPAPSLFVAGRSESAEASCGVCLQRWSNWKQITAASGPRSANSSRRRAVLCCSSVHCSLRAGCSAFKRLPDKGQTVLTAPSGLRKRAFKGLVPGRPSTLRGFTHEQWLDLSIECPRKSATASTAFCGRPVG